MQSTIFLLIGIQLVHAEKHSLQYFYTATSGLPNFPQFVTVGIVDGQPFTYYDSNIQRETPRQEWMAKSVGEDYWERNTQISIRVEQNFMDNINVAKDRLNQTGGVHTVQETYGCEWDDHTGAKNAFRQYGYDGEDFLFLDLKQLRWISPLQQGFLTKQKWDNDKAFLENDKQYFHSQCIEWLQKYLQYGKSSLEKTVSPQVSLLQKDSSSPVVCHATGFYPSGVTISWMRNGQEHHEDVEVGELLPNEDGTFQKTSTITVTPDEWKKNKYSCVVEHQGKTTEKTLKVDEIITNSKTPVPIYIIVGAAAAALLLIVIGVVVRWLYQKKKDLKYFKAPVDSSDCSSESSTGSLLSSGSGSSTSS